MKISELTKQLNQIKLGHGDLICEVHDGLDPSDPAPVKGLMVAVVLPFEDSKSNDLIVYIES